MLFNLLIVKQSCFLIILSSYFSDIALYYAHSCLNFNKENCCKIIGLDMPHS